MWGSGSFGGLGLLGDGDEGRQIGDAQRLSESLSGRAPPQSVALMAALHIVVGKEAIEIACRVDFDRYFARELAELREFEKEEMLVAGDEWITVSPRGRFMIRSICMVFDKSLRAGRPGGRYSRTI